MADKMFEQLSAELQKKTAAVDAAREALRLAEKDKVDFLQTLESLSKTAQNDTKATSASGSGKKTKGAVQKSRGITKKDREKQALSPYMVFCQEQRQNIRRANPGIVFCDEGKALGTQWGKLTKAEKDAYKRAPVPAVSQSRAAGGAANDDVEMSDSKSEDNEKSEESTQQAAAGSATKQAASASGSASAKPQSNINPLAFAGDNWHTDVKMQIVTLEKTGKFNEKDLDQAALKALKTLPYEVALVCLKKIADETGAIRNMNAFIVKYCTHLRNQWQVDDAASSSDDDEDHISETESEGEGGDRRPSAF
jgi:hypothetical protein